MFLDEPLCSIMGGSTSVRNLSYFPFLVKPTSKAFHTLATMTFLSRTKLCEIKENININRII